MLPVLQWFLRKPHLVEKKITKKNQASSVLVFVNINKTGWNSYLLCMSLAQVSYSTFFVFFVARILLPLCLLLCYTEVMMTQQNVMQCHAKRFSLKYRRHDEARYGCSRPLTPLIITNIITQYYRYEDTYKYITGCRHLVPLHGEGTSGLLELTMQGLDFWSDMEKENSHSDFCNKVMCLKLCS